MPKGMIRGEFAMKCGKSYVMPTRYGCEFAINVLSCVGWCMRQGNILCPINSSELKAWVDGTETKLIKGEFQSILSLSREFVSAIKMYDNNDVPAPLDKIESIR